MKFNQFLIILSLSSMLRGAIGEEEAPIRRDCQAEIALRAKACMYEKKTEDFCLRFLYFFLFAITATFSSFLFGLSLHAKYYATACFFGVVFLANFVFIIVCACVYKFWDNRSVVRSPV